MMSTVTTFYRASTRQFFFLTLHVVETVVVTDGIEAVGPVVAILPTQQAAEEYAQSLPANTVSD